MEGSESVEISRVARLAEVTGDAVAICSDDGSILHANHRLLGLLGTDREDILGTDIKDLVFSMSFERAADHRFPFTVDGCENPLMMKLADGSFIPVCVRALSVDEADPFTGGVPASAIVAIRSLEERYARDRQSQRLLSELQAANKRLSGTLSVIMATVGSNDMPTLLDTVLNSITDTLDAAGTTIYFSESGGFKLRGVSRGLEGARVPDFVPYGAGVATYVLREQRACRISVTRGDPADASSTGSFVDIDCRTSHRLRTQDTPPFRTLIAVPVFFGTQVLGIVELGWPRPQMPRECDVRVLEVICDYLSIELVGLVSSLRASRTAELTRELNRARDAFFAAAGDREAAWRELADGVRGTLACRMCPVTYDEGRGVHVITSDGSRIDLAAGIEEAFFSVTEPAARVGADIQTDFMHADPSGRPPGAESVRVARVDRASSVSGLLREHGMPDQGAFVDLGPDAREMGGEGGPARMFLLLRSSSQEPIDDMEFDYLTHLCRDFMLITGGARREGEEHRIAQTLQAGMRSSLGSVPGIESDSLYSSATSQALVGGDFYTLIRLPDDRAVMILGDVSGKGIEAASMSALVKTALTAYAWEGMTPARMARSLNGMLMGFSRVETFVTTFIAKIDLRSRRAVYCSAGHPPAMLLRPGEAGPEAELMSVQSGVVGAFEDMAYENGSFSFAPGDILFMYTDGAIEARNAAGDFFGERRLREALLHRGADGVGGLCRGILGELDAFANGALDDDIAMVALRFEPPRG